MRFSAASLDPDRFARPALVVAVVASGLLIYHLTRGSSFSPDDWTWIDTRRGHSVDTFLAPYNGHLSLVPIAIYRVMFATFGIGSFVPYRLLLLIVASVTGIVIFEYARHRVGEFGALLVATLLLFLGPGWNDIMQPFQIAWLIAIAAGILALSLLDRRLGRTDVVASGLVLVALASTSVGVALVIGVAVDIAVARRRWRDAWIVALPLLLYAVWALHYHSSQVELSSITNAPLNLTQTTVAGVAGVVGLSGVTAIDLTGPSVTFGASLFVVAIAVVVVRRAAGWDGTRCLSLIAALVTFSVLTSLARSFQSPFESRYMYPTCVLLALIGVELARGVTVTHRTKLALAALTLVAVISNVDVLRSGGNYLRQLGARTDATLRAVELDRGTVAPDTPLTQLPLYPLGVVTARQYFTAARALGTPANTLAELQRASPAAQGAADAQLLSDRTVEMVGVNAAPPPSGMAVALDSAAAGTGTRRGGCLNFVPTAALSPGQASGLTLSLGPGRVSVSAATTPVSVSIRRFAATFSALGTVSVRGAAIITVARDRAQLPWHLSVQSAAPVRVCTLSAT